MVNLSQDTPTNLSIRLAETVNHLGLAWWVVITTTVPQCTYFFGPFLSLKEANRFAPGYIEDLEAEEAQNISFEVKRCKPNQLTIEGEVSVQADLEPQWSGQS